MVTGLAREFADAGITANTVAPCYVRTPELAELFESGQAPARSGSRRTGHGHRAARAPRQTGRSRRGRRLPGR